MDQMVSRIIDRVKANFTHVAELEELGDVDGDGEGEGGHQVAPGAPLEGAHRARAAAARARRALALVHEERAAHRQVPAGGRWVT